MSGSAGALAGIAAKALSYATNALSANGNAVIAASGRVEASISREVIKGLLAAGDTFLTTRPACHPLPVIAGSSPSIAPAL